MKTKVMTINDREQIEDNQLEEAARILRNSGLVALPTETVYGLGANALDEEVVRKIYEAKGRSSDNPLIAHVARKEDVEQLISHIPKVGQKLMDAYWPGPLTLVFPKSGIVPYGTTGELEAVAIRMPSDTIANRLITLVGVPIATPSANTLRQPSPTTAEHVYQDMSGKIEMIVDGGPVGIGLESTIVDVSGDVPSMLRPGAVTTEMLRETLGTAEVDSAITGPLKADVKPKAPGAKYRHYAPEAELMLVESSEEVDGQKRVAEKIMELAEEKLGAGYRAGTICIDEGREYYTEGIVRNLGLRTKEETIAHSLFAVLREYDDLAVNHTFPESFSKEALGQAAMNRLTKAVGYHVPKLQS